MYALTVVCHGQTFLWVVKSTKTYRTKLISQELISQLQNTIHKYFYSQQPCMLAMCPWAILRYYRDTVVLNP